MPTPTNYRVPVWTTTSGAPYLVQRPVVIPKEMPTAGMSGLRPKAKPASSNTSVTEVSEDEEGDVEVIGSTRTVRREGQHRALCPEEPGDDRACTPLAWALATGGLQRFFMEIVETVGLAKAFIGLLETIGLKHFMIGVKVTVGLQRFMIVNVLTVGLGNFVMENVLTIGLRRFMMVNVLTVGLRRFKMVNVLTVGFLRFFLKVVVKLGLLHFIVNILYIVYILKVFVEINKKSQNIDSMTVILTLVAVMDRWRGWGPWRRTTMWIGSTYVLFSMDLLNFLFMGGPRLHARIPTGQRGRWMGPVVHKSN